MKSGFPLNIQPLRSKAYDPLSPSNDKCTRHSTYECNTARKRTRKKQTLSFWSFLLSKRLLVASHEIKTQSMFLRETIIGKGIKLCFNLPKREAQKVVRA